MCSVYLAKAPYLANLSIAIASLSFCVDSHMVYFNLHTYF